MRMFRNAYRGYNTFSKSKNAYSTYNQIYKNMEAMNKNRGLMSLSTNILVNNNISSLYSIGLESSLDELDDAEEEDDMCVEMCIKGLFQKKKYQQVLQKAQDSVFERTQTVYEGDENLMKLLKKHGSELIETLHEIIYSCYSNKKFSIAVYYVEQKISLKLIKQFPLESVQIHKMLIECYQKLYRIQDAIKTIKKIVDIYKNEENPHQYKNEIEQLLDKQISLDKKRIKKSIQERKQEGKLIQKLILESQDESYMDSEGLPVFIIPYKWFKMWKKHSFFQNQNKQNMEEEDDFSNDYYPGVLNVEELIKISETKILEDPDLVKEYQNIQIKNNLKENKDYVIMPKRVHQVFIEKYNIQQQYNFTEQGTFKRFVISLSDEQNIFQSEVTLQTINIIPIPKIFNLTENVLKSASDALLQQLYQLYISKKETITDLRTKIIRSLLAQNDINQKVVKKRSKFRLWKIDQQQNLQQIIQSYLDANDQEINNTSKKQDSQKRQIPIKAELIEAGLTLEDSEIGETDILIVEFLDGQLVQFQGSLLTQSQSSEKNDNNQSQGKKKKCNNCGNEKNLTYCQCKKVKYCDKECQRADRQKHKKECNNIMAQQNEHQQMMKKYGITELKQYTSESSKGLTGLSNLGNTCFMNSSLQCLSNQPELRKYLINHEFINDMNPNNPIGTKCYLVTSFAELLKQMWIGTDSYVSPWKLKKIIGKVSSQFVGYQQQDSQELLSYMLDGIHEDLNRVKEKPIIEQIESDGKNIQKIAAKSWDNYKKRNDSIIVDLMVGQFKSTLVCPDCEKVSITFDPFMTLSLPIPMEKQFFKFQFYFTQRDQRIVTHKLNLTFSSNSTVNDLLEELNRQFENRLDTTHLETILIKNNQLIDTFRLNTTLSSLKKREGIVFVQEIVDQYLDQEAFESSSNLKISISINGREGNSEYQQITFPRVFCTSSQNSFQQIHLKIYQLFRPYLNTYIEMLQSENIELPDNLKKLKINIENNITKNIQKEYKDLMKDGQNQLYLLQYPDDKGNKNLPYTHKGFSDLYNLQDEETEIDITLYLSDNLTNQKCFRFNRCEVYQEIKQPEYEQNNNQNTTIYDCLQLFTLEETLGKDNMWYCNKCKDHKRAKKKMELQKLPKILIIHFKRFKASGMGNYGSYFFTSGGQKINLLIEFPTQELNLTKYVQSNDGKQYIYDLTAVSNHYGNMGGGHYTAYAKNSDLNKWYDFNDSSVTNSSINQVVSEAAYLLFYRLRE